MEIRRLQPQEHVQYLGMCQTVFFNDERKDIREMLLSPEQHAEHDNIERYGVFDDTGRLLSALLVVPYMMRMNGNNVKMGGVGAVVTRPEARHKGYIKILLQAVFNEMMQAKQVFSFIYPFSFEYYRKFGYETCYSYNRAVIPVSELRGYKCDMKAEAYEPGNSVSPYSRIYKYFTRERNLSIVRGEAAWTQLLTRDPYKKLEFTYLFNDNMGRQVGYILYNGEPAADGNRLVIKECCWMTPEALHSIFGFLVRWSAEFEYIVWNVPTDINVHALFPEGYNIKWEKKAAGMNRIIDAEAALNTIKPPSRSGRVAIAVKDNFLQHNTATYAVEWESGALHVQKLGDVGPSPDLEIDIETLTQLVTGFLTPEEAMYRGDMAVLGTLVGLNALFPRRHLYIMERY